MNVTECLIRGMASVSPHAISTLARHQTKNESDVILLDPWSVLTQRCDHLRICSNTMMAHDVTP